LKRDFCSGRKSEIGGTGDVRINAFLRPFQTPQGRWHQIMAQVTRWLPKSHFLTAAPSCDWAFIAAPEAFVVPCGACLPCNTSSIFDSDHGRRPHGAGKSRLIGLLGPPCTRASDRPRRRFRPTSHHRTVCRLRRSCHGFSSRATTAPAGALKFLSRLTVRSPCSWLAICCVILPGPT